MPNKVSIFKEAYTGIKKGAQEGWKVAKENGLTEAKIEAERRASLAQAKAGKTAEQTSDYLDGALKKTGLDTDKAADVVGKGIDAVAKGLKSLGKLFK